MGGIACGRNLLLVFRPEGELPEFGSSWFAPAGEDRFAILGKDSDSVFVVGDFAAVVIEVANIDKIVFGGGHHVPAVQQNGYVAGCGRLVGMAGGCANRDRGYCWVDVGCESCGDDVDTACASIGNSCIGRWE